MTKEDRDLLICFSSNGSIGPATLKLIYEAGPVKVWNHGSKVMPKRERLLQKTLEAIDEVVSHLTPEKYLNKVKALGFDTLVYSDSDFPEIFYEITPTPMVIYYSGKLITGDMIGIVGSRKCTSYAKTVLNKTIPDLIDAGLITVSGMALGVDSLVHSITLENKGRTIAILGSGLNDIYPATNRKLFSEISEKGMVLSEFGLDMPPLRQNFPQRNRLIAGIAKSLLVVEADINSGSLITAKFALDYNRQVYAVPGDINKPTSRGTNNLIKLGAKPVTESNDILIDFGFIASNKSEYLPKNEIESKIYEVFENLPLYIDKICELTKLDIVTLNQYLTIMELQGAIENLGNSTYIKK